MVVPERKQGSHLESHLIVVGGQADATRATGVRKIGVQPDVEPHALAMLALLRPDADDAVELEAMNADDVRQWVTFGRDSISVSAMGHDAP
jgi:hypothetical protein